MFLGLKSEVIKTLSLVLPALGEIYGSHWEESMDILNSVLRGTNGGEEGLPLLVSSFRLFARLKSISESDSNDDVQDAWSDRKAGLFNALASTIDTFGKRFGFLSSLICLTKYRFLNHIPSTPGCCC